MIWDMTLSVGNDLIDSQHKKLIELTNQVETIFNQAERDLRDYDEIIRVIIKLNFYVMNHFRDEELLLKELGYPDLEAYKMEHAKFVAFLDNITTERIDLKEEEVLENLLRFLSEWIVEHIKGTDFKYKSFLK